MSIIFSFLASIAGIYSLLIFIRIIISWFSGSVSGKPVEILNRITDPYLSWWRRNLNLRFGMLDFSAVVAIVSLSLLQTIFRMLSAADRISIGSILAVVLTSLWSVVSFIAGFCLVILILRGFAYMTNRNVFSPFWGTIDSLSKPLLFNINRIIFRNRAPDYLKGIIISCLALIVLMIAGRFIILFLANLLHRLPI